MDTFPDASSQEIILHEYAILELLSKTVCRELLHVKAYGN